MTWDSDNMTCDLDNHVADDDVKKIYNYYTEKSLKRFNCEWIDKNEVYIKILLKDSSIYITIDYSEIEERYSKTVIKNKKVVNVFNYKTLEELLELEK